MVVTIFIFVLTVLIFHGLFIKIDVEGKSVVGIGVWRFSFSGSIGVEGEGIMSKGWKSDRSGEDRGLEDGLEIGEVLLVCFYSL